MLRVFVISFLILSFVAEAMARDPFRGQKGSIVEVSVVDSSGKAVLNGKGYVIDKDGLIAVGCRMILKWYEDIQNDLVVRTEDGKVFSLYRLISYNPALDLAIFKINAELREIAIPSNDRISSYIRKTIKRYRDMVKNMKNSTETLAEDVNGIKRPEAPPNLKEPDSLSDSPYVRGIRYASLKRYREAIEEYLKALKDDPDNPDIYADLGLAYYKIDRYRDSIDAYRKVLLLRPSSKSIYNRLGTVYLISGEYDEAIGIFKKALQLDYRDPKTHFNLAIASFMKGDMDSAWQEYIILMGLDEDLSRRLWDIIN